MTGTATVYQGITYVIPCGGAKLHHAAPARDLYTGSMFRHTLAKALENAVQDDRPARVLILSAKHGLVELDTVIEPYDLKMGDPGSVDLDTLLDQIGDLGIDWGSDVYGLLPKAYLSRLDEALRYFDVYIQDVYEGTCGILQQKRVNVHIALPVIPQGPVAPVAATVTQAGPEVFVGTDVNGLWWGQPVLVSYGRLREAVGLPAASAPWLLESCFPDLVKHGHWPTPPEVYAAAIDRYAAEIGHLRWAIPQDWPAGARMLERTGLTEHEHQARTITSVQELRRLVTATHVAVVLTGRTVDGYLRHKAMYEAAGFDLAAEPVVCVGALLGRTPTEAATIIRALYAAGVRRIHGLGVKGLVLDLAGGLVASVDTAEWSGEARLRGGLCTHEPRLAVWETNCPAYAREWAEAQRARAAGSVVVEMLPF